MKLMVQALQGLFLLGVRFTKEVALDVVVVAVDWWRHCEFRTIALAGAYDDLVSAGHRMPHVAVSLPNHGWRVPRAVLDGPGKLVPSH